MTGVLLIESARRWLGTPFLAGASLRGVGTDCAGLIEGVALDLGINCPNRDEVAHDLLAAADAFLVRVEALQPGTLVLLARDPGGPPLHAGLLTDQDTLIHAHWRAGVVENRFGSWFQRRVTHSFGWPDATQV
jgi:NlpC/P60 family putative phage cell wall peptidase